ncbi:MAG: type II secretion system protein [Sulfurospirillum sp.]
MKFQRRAYTMIELVLVIIVLGIVASIGAEIIVKLYDNYIKTKSINRLQAQTELVLDQISKRLSYRIKGSTIARNKSNFGDYVTLSDANNSYQVLEWIGKDNDSFRGRKNPGWSGFIDLDSNDTNRSQIKTAGSELNTTNDIIKALSNNSVILDNSIIGKNRPAIIFKGSSDYNVTRYGWDGTRGLYTYRVDYNNGANNILHLIDSNSTYPSEIYEQYNLAWSAYAIVPEGTDNDFNLTLHYNYQPWENERYDQNASTSVLVEHASTFRFIQIGNTIRIKLCIHDDNRSGNFDFSFCKERVIF